MKKPVANKASRELLALRVSRDMMAALRQLARDNRRPLAWQVAIVLEEGMKNLGIAVENQRENADD